MFQIGNPLEEYQQWQASNPQSDVAGDRNAIATVGTDILKAYAVFRQEATMEREPLGANEETIRSTASSAHIVCYKIEFDR